MNGKAFPISPQIEKGIQLPVRLLQGATASAVGLVLGAALLAGSTSAGERADRTAAFLAYLPPTRRMVWASRVVCSLVPTVILFCLSAVVALLVVYHLNRPHYSGPPAMPVICVLAVTIPLAFGGAWFIGVLSGSPAVAAVSGLALPGLTAIGTGYLSYRLYYHVGETSAYPGQAMDVHWHTMYLIAAGAIGVLLFAAASAIYLRSRREM